MTARRRTPIASRKEPRQARSSALVAAILQAAVQVLQREGAQRFTTARVAEKAGVSVGSVYQYFPNKAAILFRLQADEWRATGDLLATLLADPTRPPLERLRRLVHAFVQSECDEAAVRGALSDAAPLFRDAPEARAAKAQADHQATAFLQEMLPDRTEAERARAGELVKTTLGAVGSRFSESPRTPAEIHAFADALADMLCGYLERLAAPRRAGARRSVT